MSIREASIMSTIAVLPWIAAVSGQDVQTQVERWGVFEFQLKGPADGNPYLEVQLSAEFCCGDRRVTVTGFHDGDGMYRLRFSPDTDGEWQFMTRSNRAELDGQKGTFTVHAPKSDNHGPVVAHKGCYLRYADGTPYHQFGTTCYAWTHQPEALQELTLKTLAASPFNKIRFCVFPKSYTYNKNEPERFAFVKRSDGTFDYTRPDPAFWRPFERRIFDLQKLGIEADLILWHPYDRWGFATMGRENDDRYLRYCIARLSAFRNVWWSLANEYDLMAPNAMKGHRGDKALADWDRFFAILEKEDPHQRLRGIHNCRGFYDHTKPWVSHASLQTSDMNAGVRFRREFRKPVLYDECCYEGNVPQGWGNLNGRTMTQRFWLGTMGGCYVGHGETYKHPEDVLWWSKGGELHGESPKRIQWLKDFMAKAPAFDELEPQGDDKGRFVLAKPNKYYLLYCLAGKPQTIQLPGERPWKVDVIDPWAMQEWAESTARPGSFAVAAPKEDRVYRFTPYAPGEQLRPEARLSASVTEGTPPLAVTFSGGGGERFLWDFGDGGTSTGKAPEHTFEKPGLYTVALTVTAADGSSARSHLPIAVDRDPSTAIVRSGFTQGETPALKLHGLAARQTNGAVRLPEGEPWGWVQAGDRPLDDLRGLGSFTILGWLKPESLTTGSGGNRILFCLNKDHSGIDLVCHEDGRLRLSVNQWPDQVKNDSSPGRLQIGKWVFFAVTFDSGQAKENVAWYFSEPMDQPLAGAVKLDRTTTYTPGPVGTDIGTLAIGNFNPSMHGHGLDRQFRGEIRGLQLFGSRIGGRGVLDLDTLGRRMKE
jgi:hypothetical protein